MGHAGVFRASRRGVLIGVAGRAGVSRVRRSRAVRAALPREDAAGDGDGVADVFGEIGVAAAEHVNRAVIGGQFEGAVFFAGRDAAGDGGRRRLGRHHRAVILRGRRGLGVGRALGVRRKGRGNQADRQEQRAGGKKFAHLESPFTALRLRAVIHESNSESLASILFISTTEVHGRYYRVKH